MTTSGILPYSKLCVQLHNPHPPRAQHIVEWVKMSGVIHTAPENMLTSTKSGRLVQWLDSLFNPKVQRITYDYVKQHSVIKLTLAIRAASLFDKRDKIIDLHSSGRVSQRLTPLLSSILADLWEYTRNTFRESITKLRKTFEGNLRTNNDTLKWTLRQSLIGTCYVNDEIAKEHQIKATS